MARESTQHKLDRVRSPRVHITYDVEIGDAIELKELPFVMGVLGDLTGQPEEPLAALKDRKFVEINPDNFDTVLKGMKPHLSFSVPNKLSDDPNAGQVGVNLKFESLEDFSPENVAKQVGRSRSCSTSARAFLTCGEACRAMTSSMKPCLKRFQTRSRERNFALNWVSREVENERSRSSCCSGWRKSNGNLGAGPARSNRGSGAFRARYGGTGTRP
jgi:type VI secretion system protein ImpB